MLPFAAISVEVSSLVRNASVVELSRSLSDAVLAATRNGRVL